MKKEKETYEYTPVFQDDQRRILQQESREPWKDAEVLAMACVIVFYRYVDLLLSLRYGVSKRK